MRLSNYAQATHKKTKNRVPEKLFFNSGWRTVQVPCNGCVLALCNSYIRLLNGATHSNQFCLQWRERTPEKGSFISYDSWGSMSTFGERSHSQHTLGWAALRRVNRRCAWLGTVFFIAILFPCGPCLQFCGYQKLRFPRRFPVLRDLV